MNLESLLKACVRANASDVHLVSGSAPALRIDGKITKVRSESLTGSQIKSMCYSILTDAQRSKFENNKDIDFSFEIQNVARFRASYFYQKSDISAAFRRCPLTIPDFSDLGLPSVIGELTGLSQGLILITGPTGSGKSTTLASLLDKVNTERKGHIITIEDPIEFVHRHKKCIVSQRELGIDTDSFQDSLKHILRQDPDVCLVGEIRDIDTIRATLLLASTGHLVFSSLHTNSAPETINRILGFFPKENRDEICLQLSLILQGVISQRLLRKVQGGRIVACEHLRMTSGIRGLVRENKIHQIYGQMQLGQSKSGMMTLNQSLARLVLSQKVDIRAAFQVSMDPQELGVLLKKGNI